CRESCRWLATREVSRAAAAGLSSLPRAGRPLASCASSSLVLGELWNIGRKETGRRRRVRLYLSRHHLTAGGTVNVISNGLSALLNAAAFVRNALASVTACCSAAFASADCFTIAGVGGSHIANTSTFRADARASTLSVFAPPRPPPPPPPRPAATTGTPNFTRTASNSCASASNCDLSGAG